MNKMKSTTNKSKFEQYNSKHLEFDRIGNQHLSTNNPEERPNNSTEPNHEDTTLGMKVAEV